jgi:hypothetical protein
MGLSDTLITVLVILGIFFLAYTAYRQQGLIDTVTEIKESFTDAADDIKDGMVYR